MTVQVYNEETKEVIASVDVVDIADEINGIVKDGYKIRIDGVDLD